MVWEVLFSVQVQINTMKRILSHSWKRFGTSKRQSQSYETTHSSIHYGVYISFFVFTSREKCLKCSHIMRAAGWKFQ